MTAPAQIVVRAAPELRRALRQRGVVRLELPSLDDRTRERTERRFAYWRQVCGCHLGALLLLATLAWRIPVALRAPAWTWSALATEGGLALAAAIAGKGVAVAGARLALAVDVALLRRRLRRAVPNPLGG
jgi:hypothetical protein